MVLQGKKKKKLAKSRKGPFIKKKLAKRALYQKKKN